MMKELTHATLTTQGMNIEGGLNSWTKQHVKHLTVSIVLTQQVNVNGMKISKNVRNLQK